MDKIAITANSAASAWIMRRKFANELKKNGYEVYFVVPYDKKYTTLLKSEFFVKDVYLMPNGKNIFADIKTLFCYFAIFREVKPKVLLNYHIKPNIYATFIGKILNIKVINNVAGLGSIFINGGVLSKVVEILYRFSFKHSSLVFFQNGDDLEQFVKNKIVDKDRVDLLPGSGVDLEKFLPKDIEKSDIFRFTMLSRIIVDKGINELAEASEILKNSGYKCEIVLIGELDLNDKRSISKEKMELWEKENFIKHLEFIDDVRDEISKSDCVILPSYKEGKPRSLLEASAMGKPTIATNVSGCKDVIDDGKNGFLCEVKNAKDLADKMKQMMDLDQTQRVKMGKYARKKMEKEFDEKIVIDKYLQALEN